MLSKPHTMYSFVDFLSFVSVINCFQKWQQQFSPSYDHVQLLLTRGGVDLLSPWTQTVFVAWFDQTNMEEVMFWPAPGPGLIRPDSVHFWPLGIQPPHISSGWMMRVFMERERERSSQLPGPLGTTAQVPKRQWSHLGCLSPIPAPS